MKKFKRILILMLSGLFTFKASSQDAYQYKVRPGEALSKIVSRFFPNEKIYGSVGKLNEVASMNIGIKDKNLIFPEQVITLPIYSNTNKAEVKSILIEKSDKPFDVNPHENLDNLLSPKLNFNLAILYGAKFLDYYQTGVLGQASLNGIFFNNLKLDTEILYENWKGQFSFDTFNINYKTSTSILEESLCNFKLGLVRQWYFVSTGVDQVPLLNDRSATVTLSKQSLLYVGLGAIKELNMFFIRPVSVELKSEVRYPVKSFLQDSQLKSSALSGYHLYGQAHFKIQLLNKKEYTLFANWINGLGYQKTFQNIEGGVANGKVESGMMSASSTLGLQFNF